MTNALFCVRSAVASLSSLPPVLVRVYGEKTELLIDRESENAVFAELSEAGFAPPYYGRFTTGRCEGYLPGFRPLRPEEMGLTAPVDFQSKIAVQLARMHSMQVPTLDGASAASPGLWVTIDRWHAVVSACVAGVGDPERAAAFERLNLPQLKRELAWLRDAQLPSPLNAHGKELARSTTPGARAAQAFMCDSVFAHNDLLSGNVLWSAAEERIQLIDFEYSAQNYRGFDIANHFCEYAGFDFNIFRWYPAPSQQRTFLRAYLAAAAAAPADSSSSSGGRRGGSLLEQLAAAGILEDFLDACVRYISRFALAAHLFWAHWAILQAVHSPIQFDFLDYARLRVSGYYFHKGLFAEHFS